MIDALKPLAIFAELVRHGSLRGAARSLNLSPSVISYHLAQLEERTGTALVYRSTRRLSLTSDGEKLYACVQRMLAAAEEGLSLLAADLPEAFGKIKIAMPALLSRSPLLQRMALFAQRNPRVEMEFHFSDTRVDVIAQGYDLAIRMGAMSDSGLKAKKIDVLARKLVCSPAYLKDKSVPKKPADLNDWQGIRLRMMSAKRTLLSKTQKKFDLQLASQVTVDNVDAMTCLCVAGLGLATPPVFMLESLLASGDLVEVLPNWQVEPISIYAVWPANSPKSGLSARLLTHLAEST